MKSWCALVLGLVVAARGADGPGFRVERDVAFLAPDRAEKLDLYLPDGPAPGGGRPAFVWIHGGGWTGGTKREARATNVCGTLARAGYVVVNIDYRLGPGAWPTNLHDGKHAVRFLRAHAPRLGVDPARIAVGGGSAGGHLALMVALTAGKPGLEPADADSPYPGVSSAVRCAVNLYGITNILSRREPDREGVPGAPRPLSEAALQVHRATGPEDPVLRLASPVTHVARDSVPLLTLHGRKDATVDYLQAEELDRVARERGARHELVMLERAGHTFDLQTWGRKPLERDLRPVVLAFLERHLR